MLSNVEMIKFDDPGWERTKSSVVMESSLTIFLNGEQIVTLMCTNNSKEFLAIGFLANERLIDIAKIEQLRIVRVENEIISIEAPYPEKISGKDQKIITPGLGKGITFSMGNHRLKSIKISSPLTIVPHEVFYLMKKLSENSTLYKLTHGVHNAAICRPDEMEIFQFDLGRHNAVDKLYGQCLAEKCPLSEKIIVTSGRISSEILTKVGMMGVPILISRSSPTDKAIRLADNVGITLIANVRGSHLSIYTHPERVKLMD
jgi:FdhD protein